MEIDLFVFGDVNQQGDVNVSTETTIASLLDDSAKGIIDDKGLKLIQIGGPLGICLSKENLHDRLEVYKNNLRSNTILFLNDSTCPVDFARFLTRYVRRELRVTSNRIEELSTIIDSISNGTATEKDLERLAFNGSSDQYPEADIARLINFLVKEFRTEFLDHIIHRRCKLGICRRLFKAQCINACPAEVHVPGFVALMAEGKLDEAYGLMRRSNPFSFVCGRICPRFCESACRRGQIEETVGVRALKAYTTDLAFNIDDYKEDISASRGRKVAVVGAGLAGLTAAYFLARTGYEVVVYEAGKTLGGKIPSMFLEEILPAEMIENEVQLIKNLGVAIKSETTVGKDISIDSLKDTYDAILLATGQPKDTESGRENIQLGENGHIDINASTHETNFLGVFVTGDVHIPGSPAEVIADARHAAEAIDKYLEGKGLYFGTEIVIPEPQLYYGIWDIKPEEGLTSSPTKEGAETEALRCLRCDRNSRESI